MTAEEPLYSRTFSLPSKRKFNKQPTNAKRFPLRSTNLISKAPQVDEEFLKRYRSRNQFIMARQLISPFLKGVHNSASRSKLVSCVCLITINFIPKQIY